MIVLGMLVLVVSAQAAPPIYMWHWKTGVTPSVVICQDSNLDIDWVRDSLDFMIERYQMDFPSDIEIYKGNCPDTITREYKDVIFFRDFEQDHRYAYTNTKFVTRFGSRYIDNATVFFPNDISIGLKRSILRHEIGHALGLGHNPYDYVMAP